MITKRATTGAFVLALAFAAAACSPPEKRIVDQYFNALAQQDTQTLSSFAAVKFDKKVQSWTVGSVSEETKEPAPLPALLEKQEAAEKAVDKNKRDAQVWSNDTDIYKQIDQIKELRKRNAAIPAGLQAVAQKYDEFSRKDHELKRAVGDARTAFEAEKRLVALSVGTIDGSEKSVGDMQTKTVDLTLTIDGQPANYMMTLRRYNLTGDAPGRMISRWIVQKLEPKA
jgi:hypothetical protein